METWQKYLQLSDDLFILLMKTSIHSGFSLPAKILKWIPVFITSSIDLIYDLRQLCKYVRRVPSFEVLKHVDDHYVEHEGVLNFISQGL